MEKIISSLFSQYLSEQKIVADSEYSRLAKRAIECEKLLRSNLNTEETECFEELFEITSQIHFLEVKDAFCEACKMGARASQEFIT